MSEYSSNFKIIASVFTVLVVSFCFGSANLFANEPEELTEEEAVKLALKNSRRLKNLDTMKQIASHRMESSAWIDNPELRISDISTKYITDRFEEISLGLRWRPPGLGQMSENKQSSNVNLWEKKVELSRYKSELISRVRFVYANVIRDDELAEISNRKIELEKKRLALVEQLKGLGHRSIVYYTKARMWLRESQNEHAKELDRQMASRRKLANMTGRTIDTVVQVQNVPDIKKSLEKLQAIADENRPEIKLVQVRKQLALDQYDRERYKLIPWISYVQMTYHHEKYEKDWGELTFGIDLPLFNWNTGNIRATKLGIQRKEHQSDAIKEKIDEEVRLAYNIYKEAALDYKLTKEDSERLISIVKGIVDKTDSHNTLPPDEILEMELTIEDSKRMLAEKRNDLAEALIQLMFVIGVDDIKQLEG